MRHHSFKFPILLIFIVLIIAACNNDSKQKAETTATKEQASDTSEKKETATAGALLIGSGDFAYLAIPKDSLTKFFTPPPGGLNARKLVFRFSYNGDSTSKIVIDGFITNPANINYLKRPPVIAEQLPFSSNFKGQKIYLSDLELTRKKYDSLPPAGTNTHLIFVPFRFTSGPHENCISYQIFWSTPATLTEAPKAITGDALNPSPPADPGL